jgi:hypothetical protein
MPAPSQGVMVPRQPSENELAAARDQGELFELTAQKLLGRYASILSIDYQKSDRLAADATFPTKLPPRREQHM